ncbi:MULTISPECIES: hypothetical protein [unclassified Variovorax]|uniref:hypothetical protein n=1 Tax=unclassified Variovorax TaxID=663243 RepID=UPI0032E74AA8
MPKSSYPLHQTAENRPASTQVLAPMALTTSSLPAMDGPSRTPTPEEAAAFLKLINNFDRALIALIHATQFDSAR